MTKTVSPGTAKALKEAGFDEPTELIWCEFLNKSSTTPTAWLSQLCSQEEYDELCERSFIEELSSFAAPDVSELLDALPESTLLGKERNEYSATYVSLQDRNRVRTQRAKTPAEALALLWLELRKQKLV